MKNLLMILVLFMLAPCAANAASSYTVLSQGSKQPYVCAACSLRTPYPDQKTIDTLTAWKEGKPPFTDSATHRGIARSLSSGDTVAICNGCGCATYTLQEEGLWGEGIFKAMQAHQTGTSSMPPKRGSTASKAAS